MCLKNFVSNLKNYKNLKQLFSQNLLSYFTDVRNKPFLGKKTNQKTHQRNQPMSAKMD